MVTYCSETNTSEPAFTTIINLSEKKKKLIVQQKQGRTCKHWRRLELLGWKRSAFKIWLIWLRFEFGRVMFVRQKIVSLCTVCRKGHQKIQKRLKVSSSCSQPEYRNSLKRWALNFLYIYIHIHFHIPIYIFIFLPNLVSSWKRTLQKGLSANFLRLMLLIWLSPILVFMHRCCLQRLVVWLHSSKKQSLF